MPDTAGEHWGEGWEGDLGWESSTSWEGSFPVTPQGRAGQHGRVQWVQPGLQELFPINHSMQCS